VISGKGRIAGACVAALLAVASTASVGWADDDAAIRARMIELERQQRAMQEEMQKLRDLLEASGKAPAAAEVEGEPARVEEVERKQDVITEEVRKIKEALVLPETKELKSEYGLGPAASSVYHVKQGLSLASYGEFNYKNVVSDAGTASDSFDFVRLILYTGYRFTDKWLVNAEIEFEHASAGPGKSGEVSVEFATIEYLAHPALNARAGLVLVPMGFLNEIHEPPFYHGNVRPQVEQQILPSTWRVGGAGFFGEILPGLEYRTYAVTGLNAKGFRNSGIRGGRQNGSNEIAEDWAWTGRLDYSPIEMLMIGASAYLGNSGQGQTYGNAVDGFFKPDVFTQIYEGHAQLRTHGFEARVLGAWSSLDDAAILSTDTTINPGRIDLTKPNTPVSGSQWGWYGEVAYDVMPLVFSDTEQYLAPWFRYSHFDTQDDVPSGYTSNDAFDRDFYEVGISYKPIPSIVFKLDYRNIDSETGEQPDEVRIGAGFVY
jgi:hypothetical protein